MSAVLRVRSAFARLTGLCFAGLAAFFIPSVVQSAPGAGDLPFTRWVEPREHAFSVDVPTGWKLEGGLTYLGPIDPQTYISVTSPDGKLRVFLGDSQLLARQVPGQLTRQQTNASEGQTFKSPTGAPVMMQRFMTGPQYAKYHIGWRLCQQPAWVAQADLPDLSRSLADAVAPYARAYNVRIQASAGEVSFTCGNVQGVVYAATMLSSSNAGPIQMWNIYRLAGFQSADPMRSMLARYVMEHMLATFALDRNWEAALERKTREITGAVIQMENAATQSALAASRQQNETLARLNHPNPGVPKRKEQGTSGSVNTILGTQHMCDAIGRCSTVSIGDGNTFMDHSGNIRNGPGSGGPPDNSGVWSQMYVK